MDFFRKLYDQFVAIVGPGTCTDADIKKYLQWGNGNLETSLNYYFEAQLKAAKKQSSHSQKKSNNNKNKGQKDNKSQNPIPSEPIFQSAADVIEITGGGQPQVTDAFSVLHEGSLKQRELDKLIMSLRVDAKQPELGRDRRVAGNSSSNGSALIIEKNNNTFKQKIDNLSKEMDGQVSQSFSSNSQSLRRQENCQSQGDVNDNVIEITEKQYQQETYSENESPLGMSTSVKQPSSAIIEDGSVEKDINQYSKDNLADDQPFEEKNVNPSEIKCSQFPQKQGFEEMEEQLKQVIQKGEENNQSIQFPCFLGTFELQGHSLTTQVCRITKGEEVILKIEKNTPSAVYNQNKKKNSQNNTNNGGKNVMQFIRIVWNEREVGRLNPEYEEILYPLIERGYIYVQASFVYAPHLLSAFSPISLLVTVSLIKGCLTKPITKIVEENADTKESYILSICAQTKTPFAKLFEALGLRKVLGTLVNIADKPKTRQVVGGSKTGQQGSSIMMQVEKQQEGSESVNGQDSNNLGQKQQQQQQNKIDLNDPFARLPKQKTLMSFKLEQRKSITQDDESSRQQQNSKEQQPPSSDNQSLPFTQSNEFDLEEVFEEAGTIKEIKLSSPPSSFKSNLHPYQRQALTWMLSREGKQTDINELITKDTRSLHPLWEQYALPGKTTSKQHYIYFNPCSGQLSLSFPRAQENCRGGILADEMGLGKTVMMLSLIHSNKRKNHMFFENQVNSDQGINQIDNYGPFKDDQRNSSLGSNTAKPQQKHPSIIQMMRKDARTLVILPVTLLAQWQDEIAVHSLPNSLTFHAYYGSSRGEVDNLGSFDIVFTTYGTISSEFASSSQNKPLYRYNWHRIVLDEAHYIKGRVIQCAKAVYALSGDNRWCMTGTPLQNKLDELFPLLHFIQLEPWSDYLWWNNHINKPHEKGEKQVFDVLKTILKPVLLRRTKKSKDSQGKPIILLPEKYSRIESVVLTEEERQFYDSVYQSSKQEFEGFLANGILLSNYMKVFELLLRLRQICDHIFMMTTRGDVQSKEGLESKLRAFVARRNKAIIDEIQLEERKRDLERGAMEILDGWKADNNNNNRDNQLKQPQINHSHFEVIIDENDQEQRVEIPDINTFDISETYLQKVLADIEQNTFTACNICLEDMEDAVITACLHVSCRLCAVKSIEANGMCPICRKFISREDIMTVPRDNRFTFDAESNYVRSSKIAAVMGYIEGLRNTDDKCLVFTQFLGIMDLLEIDFKRSNVKFIVRRSRHISLRLDGSLSQKQRAEVINKFNEDDSIKVFMISLKAGGVGLNLVRANHVLMVDPWWNPAVEEQAIERCHRIGQKKDVYVTRFICENSIESRMIKLHNEKRDLFENTISAAKKDKKEQNIENFKYLMQEYDKN